MTQLQTRNAKATVQALKARRPFVTLAQRPEALTTQYNAQNGLVWTRLNGLYGYELDAYRLGEVSDAQPVALDGEDGTELGNNPYLGLREILLSLDARGSIRPDTLTADADAEKQYADWLTYSYPFPESDYAHDKDGERTQLLNARNMPTQELQRRADVFAETGKRTRQAFTRVKSYDR